MQRKLCFRNQLTAIGLCVLIPILGSGDARAEAGGLPANPTTERTILAPGQAPALTDGFVARPESDFETDLWNVSLYHGKYSRTDLGSILLAGQTDYEPAYITVLALNRPLPYRLWRTELEGEGQIVRHSGIQKHLEFNGVVLARITEPFRGTPFSVGVGEGLSFATRNPDLENTSRSLQNIDARTETSRNLLNYLVFELDMALPVDMYAPRAFLRVHHRSGIFGTLCPSICGSNFVAYGVKFTY